MKTARLLIRAGGLIAMVIMILVPPWQMVYTSGPEKVPGTESLGYHPLWYRLEVSEGDPRSEVGQKIQVVRLGLQLGVVLILTNGLLAVVGKRS